MLTKLKLFLIASTVVASASAAFAATPSQDQTKWFVDSGRYINGEVPSYPAPAHGQALVEGRNSAVIATTSTDRGAMVEELGN
jgi:hypothetical protein